MKLQSDRQVQTCSASTSLICLLQFALELELHPQSDAVFWLKTTTFVHYIPQLFALCPLSSVWCFPVVFISQLEAAFGVCAAACLQFECHLLFWALVSLLIKKNHHWWSQAALIKIKPSESLRKAHRQVNWEDLIFWMWPHISIRKNKTPSAIQHAVWWDEHALSW